LNKLKNQKNETITLNPCGLIANTLFNDVISLDSGIDSDGNNLVMLEDGIAWQSDIEYKFDQPDGFVAKKANCPNGCYTTTCACTDDWCTKDSMLNKTKLYYEASDGECYRYFYPNDDETQYLYETYPMVISPIDGVLNEHFIVWMRNAALPKFRKLYGFMDKKVSKGTKITFKINANWIVHRFKGSKTLVLTTTSIFGGKNPALGQYFIGVGIFCLVSASFFGLKHYLDPRELGNTKYLKYKEE